MAAHNFKHGGNDVFFNMSKFNKDCRKLLYNTERNNQRRKVAENRYLSTPSTPPPSTPPRSTGPPATTPKTARPDSPLTDDEPEDDFFNFKRSAKKAKDGVDSKGTAANELDREAIDDADGEAAAEVDEQMSQSTSACAKKRQGSPVKPPLSKRSMKCASVFDHLQSVVQDGMHVDDITKLLRAYIRSLSHRKGLILACKDVKLLIQELEENGGQDDVMDIAANYNIALSKLPAILE